MQIRQIDGFNSSLELFERLFSGKPFCFFLDSGMDNEKLGRFSFMGAEPFLVVKSKGRLIEEHRAQSTEHRVKRYIGNPFLVLKELIQKYRNNFYINSRPPQNFL